MWCAIRWCNESFKPTKRAVLTTASDARRKGSPTLPLELVVSFGSVVPWVPTKKSLRTWAQAALGPEKKSWVLSVRIVGKVGSRSVNAKYRGKDKPTNVLSFAGSGACLDGCHYLGELVICAAVVAAEARAQDKTLEAHWAHMTVHGLLHLRGFDHEVAAEAGKMEALEVQILDRLGFSDPYR